MTHEFAANSAKRHSVRTRWKRNCGSCWIEPTGGGPAGGLDEPARDVEEERARDPPGRRGMDERRGEQIAGERRHGNVPVPTEVSGREVFVDARERPSARARSAGEDGAVDRPSREEGIPAGREVCLDE